MGFCLAFLIAVASAAPQPASTHPTSASREKASPPVSLTITAVQATNDGRTGKDFGPGLEKLRSVLTSLDYDSFRVVKSLESPAPFNQETRLPLTDTHTLCVTPLSKESDGRVRIRTRIEEKARPGAARGAPGTVRTAVDTTSAIAPGKPLLIGGLRLEKGQLAVVIQMK